MNGIGSCCLHGRDKTKNPLSSTSCVKVGALSAIYSHLLTAYAMTVLSVKSGIKPSILRLPNHQT